MVDPQAAAAELTLRELTSKHRLLLLLGPYRENGSLQWQQQAVSASQGALAKRNVRVATLIGQDEGYLDSTPISREQVARLREALEVDVNKFALLLLDQGGGELLYETRPVKVHELLEKLDAAADDVPAE